MTHVRAIPGPSKFSAECPVHGVQTFVWNESAAWWHCSRMYVTAVDFANPEVNLLARACQSVILGENFSIDGGVVEWYPGRTLIGAGAESNEEES